MAGSSLLSAQCANPWVSTGGFLGTDGSVLASTMHDPDGPGPATARLVLGGSFRVAGDILANSIAAWDPAIGTWAPFGAGLDIHVRALVALPNGELLAAGDNPGLAGPSFQVARWNGSTWLPLAAGFSDQGGPFEIRAATVLPNGDLVVAGLFTVAGGTPANNIARWNGTTWSALGTGLGVAVDALTTMPNGDLVAGGRFTVVGGLPATGVARWNGSVWTPLGLVPSNFVTALASLPNGDLLAGFNLSLSGQGATSTLRRWNGSVWSQVGSVTMPGQMLRIEVLLNGDFLAAGGDLGGFCQRWNGVAWSPLGASPDAPVHTSTHLPNFFLNIVIGGAFTSLGSTPARSTARWDGSAWNAFGVPSLAGKGQALLVLPNGDVIAAGGNSVVRWNGTAWSPLESFAANASVLELAALPNGDVLAGGSLAPSGPGAHLARWNGTSWLPLGAGVNGTVRAIATQSDGSLIAGGNFSMAGGAPAPGIARWNGTAWSSLAGGVTDSFAQPGAVNALATAPNGDLFVGGSFTRAGTVVTSNIARWNGSAWSALGTGLIGSVRALAVLPNGDLLAGGGFVLGGSVLAQVVRWNGITWSAVAGGPLLAVTSIAVLPNGGFLVGSDLFGQGLSPVWLARWNGSGWSAVNLGVDRFVDALAFHPSGEVFVGGRFTTAGGVVSPGVARLSTTCPATANANGTGCTGAGGLNVLVASSLPWVGSTCRMIASGLPAASLAIAVTGWSSVSIPLAAILPQGSPGCALLANPDLFAAVTTGAGKVPVALTIPNSVALSGVVVHQQVVALQIVAGSIAAATSTNALTLQCGAF
ncbi:MAG: hypothetical protein MUC36_28835 [Planctomycetes bacterium]|nr:hypothetical protein [Planctomycetota bacterium]